MKYLSQTILLLIFIAHSYSGKAQWSGPSGGALETNNLIRIFKNGNQTTCYGCAPIPPLLEVFLKGTLSNPNTIYYPLYVGFGGQVGIGTNTPYAGLHLANSNSFLMTRKDGNAFCRINPIGQFRLTTDGLADDSRGFFINNGTKDFLKVTESEFLVANTTTDLFRINNTITAYADIMISDGAQINFRAYTDGLVRAREVRVNLATIPPDYVFEKEYNLLPLTEVEAFIQKHKHLPNIPSAKQMTDEGAIAIGNMQLKLLEKIEELTLYLIALKKESEELKKANEELKSRICNLEGQ